MNHGFRCRLTHDPTTFDTEQTLALALTVTLHGITQNQNVREELRLREKEIRQAIFDVLQHTILPAILEKLEGDAQTTAEIISAHSSWQDGPFEIHDPKKTGLLLGARLQRMVQLIVKTNAPVNSKQALSLVRPSLAFSLTEAFLQYLRQHYLGITRTSYEAKIEHGNPENPSIQARSSSNTPSRN